MTDDRSTTVAVERLGPAPQVRGDPLRLEPEDRLAGRGALEVGDGVADDEHVARRGLAARHLDPVHPDGVRVRGQVEVVAGAHEGDDDAELHRELAAQRLDPVRAGRRRCRRRRGSMRSKESSSSSGSTRISWASSSGLSGDGAACCAAAASSACRASSRSSSFGICRARTSAAAPTTRKGSFGSAGTSASAMITTPAIWMAPRCWPNWWRMSPPMSRSVDARVTMMPVDDREQQRGDLRDQPVADREQAVGRDGVADGLAVLRHPDDEPADEVDQRDDDRGDRVALDELRGTVHRPVEVRLGGDVRTPLTGLVLVDEPRVEVGVDRHLLAGHRVEGEARRDLGDAARRRW